MSDETGDNQATQPKSTRFGDGIVDPAVGKDTQFQPGVSGNPDGRPKGRRSLSTIIRELGEGEQKIDWAKVSPDVKKFMEQYGTEIPFEAIVIKAQEQAILGDQQAREWLRKAGYGDKLDITPVVPEGVASIIYAKRIEITVHEPGQQPGTPGGSTTDAQ